MRIGSSTLGQNKTLNKSNIIKGIVPQTNKKFNPTLSDTFNTLNAWDPISGTWSTDGNTVSSSTSSSSYPILTSFDLKSQNITATMSLTSAGAGVVFWLQDASNWWAGVTFYTQGSESYITGSYENCVPRGFCYGIDANGFPWGCESCSTGYNYGTRTRFNFYVRLLSSVNGTVSSVANLLLRSTCNATSSFSPATVSGDDNINGIELSTSGDIITVRGRDDSNNYYGSTISYTASSPNKGYKSGVIFTPGSNYQESSLVQDISIVGS
jgi:hypothetical protein